MAILPTAITLVGIYGRTRSKNQFFFDYFSDTMLPDGTWRRVSTEERHILTDGQVKYFTGSDWHTVVQWTSLSEFESYFRKKVLSDLKSAYPDLSAEAAEALVSTARFHRVMED